MRQATSCALGKVRTGRTAGRSEAGCCRPSWPRSRLKGLGLRDWGDFGEGNKQPQGRTMNEVRRLWRWRVEGGMKGPPENGLRVYCGLIWGDTLQCSQVTSGGAGGREGDVHVVFGGSSGGRPCTRQMLYLLYCLSSLVLKKIFFKSHPIPHPFPNLDTPWKDPTEPLLYKFSVRCLVQCQAPLSCLLVQR